MLIRNLLESDIPQLYYHGTPTLSRAKSIGDIGLSPSHVDIKYEVMPRQISRPVEDRVYMSKNISYAVIYMLGGIVAGTDYFNDKSVRAKTDRYGGLAVFSQRDFVDIIPDEDDIGNIILSLDDMNYDYDYNSLKSKPWWRFFIAEVKKILTPKQRAMMKDNTYDTYDDVIRVGKKVLRIMNNTEKMAFIDAVNNVGHRGNIMPIAVYKFDKFKNTIYLKKDCSNFLDLAKRIK